MGFWSVGGFNAQSPNSQCQRLEKAAGVRRVGEGVKEQLLENFPGRAAGSLAPPPQEYARLVLRELLLEVRAHCREGAVLHLRGGRPGRTASLRPNHTGAEVLWEGAQGALPRCEFLLGF